MPDFPATDEALRAEADELLDGKGLRELLARYGEVQVTGSYALSLMAWRDLDIYVASAELSPAWHFQLGARIAARLTPAARRAILQIKSQCWRDPGYRKTFTSQDIYRAVLDGGVTDLPGFRRFLRDLR